ncbi:ABC transporter ATP-binding protein [Pikeienuella sp. HZG-20]|uniref:ABC transporter ATP-binding protein n=1 Tax=Paludibacillus litoralis TaxID=3133267 RepID=UPI0030EC4AEA
MAEPVLSVHNLRKSFGALKATDGVTLELRPGEIHALIGPNGAGKSTLIKQIAGEIRQDGGEIRLEGEEISALSTQARARRGLARSFQVSSLAPEFSVLQNVMLAVAGASGRRLGFFRDALRDDALIGPARRHIARAGLEGRARARAADLSHGERRSLEIAMALALDPKAFLLDEPMAGMGPEGSARLTTLLAGLRAEAPILLVEHDMDAVFALADRITVLVYGAALATGTVAEIRANPDVRRAYLGDED